MSSTRLLFSGSSEVVHMENGERVFPCRCGETHRGDYALHDWAHHNCYHRSPLVDIGAPDIEGYYMCPDCGEVFLLAGSEAAR